MENNDNNDNGGYFVPKYLWTDKSGFRARLWRIIGRIFHNRNIVEKGRDRIDVHKYIIDLTETYRLIRDEE